MEFLTGKTAIITGAGYAKLSDGRCGSIGYGIATAYAKEGANLVITGRNVSKLENAKEELERLYGIKVLALAADISEGADNENIAKGVEIAGVMDTVVAHTAINCDAADTIRHGHIHIHQVVTAAGDGAIAAMAACRYIDN